MYSTSVEGPRCYLTERGPSLAFRSQAGRIDRREHRVRERASQPRFRRICEELHSRGLPTGNEMSVYLSEEDEGLPAETDIKIDHPLDSLCILFEENSDLQRIHALCPRNTTALDKRLVLLADPRVRRLLEEDCSSGEDTQVPTIRERESPSSLRDTPDPWSCTNKSEVVLGRLSVQCCGNQPWSDSESRQDRCDSANEESLDEDPLILSACEKSADIFESPRMSHNMLERVRRSEMNARFVRLREVLPGLERNDRISKLRILRSALETIRVLHAEHRLITATMQALAHERRLLLRKLGYAEKQIP